MRSQIAAARSAVQAALDATVFATAFAAGQQITLTEAFVTLQSPLNEHPTCLFITVYGHWEPAVTCGRSLDSELASLSAYPYFAPSKQLTSALVVAVVDMLIVTQ